jgi:hypothetical protein
LSIVATDLESVRELHNVSVDSRDMGRRRWRLENTITNSSPMMEKKRHVAIISPSNASVTNQNLCLSSVKDVENSLHDVHVSVDSHGMGKIVRSCLLRRASSLTVVKWASPLRNLSEMGNR